MKIVFHHPIALKKKPTSASGLRPLKMIEAFEKLGHDVTVIAGNSRERARQMKSYIKSKAKPDLIYAESSTVSYLLSDPSHLPLRPLQDIQFFRHFRKLGVQVGLYYRDFHWLHPHYGQHLGVAKKTVGKIAHLFDYSVMNWGADVIYLPTEEYFRHFGVDKHRLLTLPPGAPDIEIESNKSFSTTLRLFYVGGIQAPLYKLSTTLKYAEAAKNVATKVVCRQEELDHFFQEANTEFTKTDFLHRREEELSPLYRDSDIFLYLFEPTPYMGQALSYKVFEAIGHGIPILARKGTPAGRLVDQFEIGWTLETTQEITDLLNHLDENRDEILKKRENTLAFKKSCTWEKRAQQVISDLTVSARD